MRNLPSATTARFLIVLALFSMITFQYSGWLLQDLLEQSMTSYVLVYSTYVTGLCFILMLALYVRHPFELRKTFGPTETLTKGLAFDHIVSLSEKTGVKFHSVLVGGDVRQADAMVFGLPGRPILLLGKGLILSAIRRPKEFDARIAHELGHVSAGDVTLTLLARSMVRTTALLFLTIVSLRMYRLLEVVVENWDAGLASATITSVAYSSARWFFLNVLNYGIIAAPHFLFWITIITLEYRAVLRVRELYADNFARGIVGETAISTILATPVRMGTETSSIEVFRNHPGQGRRLRMVVRPDLVGLPSVPTFLWVGFLGGTILASFERLLDYFLMIPALQDLRSLTDFDQVLTAPPETIAHAAIIMAFGAAVTIPFLISSILMTVRFCAHLISNSFSSIRLPRAGAASLGLGIGLFIGQWLNPYSLRALFSGDRFTFTFEVYPYDFFSGLVAACGWIALVLLIVPTLSLLKYRGVLFRVTGLGWAVICLCLAVFFSSAMSLINFYISAATLGSDPNPGLVQSSLLWMALSSVSVLISSALMGAKGGKEMRLAAHGDIQPVG